MTLLVQIGGIHMLTKLKNHIQHFIHVQKIRKSVQRVHANDQAEKERIERVRIAFQNRGKQ